MSPSSPYRKVLTPIISPRGSEAGCPRPSGIPSPFLSASALSNQVLFVVAQVSVHRPRLPHTHTAKASFNMRTRSSAKDNANQGPESSLSPNTAETSKEAPPKAAKPRGRAQDKPGAPPARKKSADAGVP